MGDLLLASGWSPLTCVFETILCSFALDVLLWVASCVQGSIPGHGVICGLSLLLVLFLAPSGFSLGAPVFPSPEKPPFPNPVRSGLLSSTLSRASDSSDRTPLNLHLHFFCYWFVPSQSWFVEGPVFRQARLFSNDNLVWQGEVTCGDLEVAMVTSFICILPALACLLSALLSINTQLTLQWRARWPHN